ncbi:hypothetical protein B0H11DRAFT_1939856 [Mycena galericulata]|nr:hypothetical protein B0H11DRAFT_1939856 [Mycena galericulata]
MPQFRQLSAISGMEAPRNALPNTGSKRDRFTPDSERRRFLREDLIPALEEEPKNRRDLDSGNIRKSTPSSLFSNAVSDSDSQRTTTETSTVWGPGTLSGRALLALGEVTIRGLNQIVIWRRLATIRLRAPSQSMCDDLLELCRPAMYSLRIRKEVLRLILTQICVESKWSMLVLALCDWRQDEARLILHEVMRSLSDPELLHPSGWPLEGINNFLFAIIQVKGQWRDLVVEAVFQDLELFIGHPIHILCTQTTSESPLSTLQKTCSSKMRADIWLSLHASGQRWEDRMLEIEENMAAELDLSASKLLDAINDVVIFTRKVLLHIRCFY